MFLFQVAGLSTSSTVLTFAAYELVANPTVQQKLYDEIVKTDATLNGKRLTYDALQKMTYLDQVISETLRKWSPLSLLDRKCVKNYEFQDDDRNLKFTIEAGSILFIPISAIQRDSKHFNDPEKFDPDRFSDANRNKIAIGTYLPFGIGPRNCIGMCHHYYYFLSNFANRFSFFLLSNDFFRIAFCDDENKGSFIPFAAEFLF